MDRLSYGIINEKEIIMPDIFINKDVIMLAMTLLFIGFIINKIIDAITKDGE